MKKSIPSSTSSKTSISSSIELKDRVEHWVEQWRTCQTMTEGDQKGLRQLYIVALILIVSLLVANGMGAVVIAMIYGKNEYLLRSPDEKADKDESWFGSDTNPLSTMADASFNVYFGFFLWVTTMLAGLGLEFFVLMSFAEKTNEWTTTTESLWKLAQFLFPLIGAASIGFAVQHNFLLMFTLVFGLWKFGFPETVTYMTEALYDASGNFPYRVSNFINSVGNIVHHGAASLVVCMLLSGAVVPSRHILNPILILIMQHWFACLLYLSPMAYMVIELCLEAMFEWVLFSSLKHGFANHWIAALASVCMLLAHWMYVVAAAINWCGHRPADDRSFGISSKTLETNCDSSDDDDEPMDDIVYLEDGLMDEP